MEESERKVTIFICGQVGVGKTIIATELHNTLSNAGLPVSYQHDQLDGDFPSKASISDLVAKAVPVEIVETRLNTPANKHQELYEKARSLLVDIAFDVENGGSLDQHLNDINKFLRLNH